jgi:uncharacterized SAM-binding protein YcdF (DUF218 family)
LDLFILKKTIGAMLMPLPVCLILFVLAALAYFTARKKLAKGLTFLSLSLLLILSTPYLPDYLLGKLEHKYLQFDLSQKVERIVILGCGHVNDPGLAISAQLYPCSTVRIVEAMRLLASNPDSIIITSGNMEIEPYSNAEMNKRLLIAMGVNENRIISVEQSLDTEDEAQNLRTHLEGRKFALVTSASHMSRSVRLFENQGLHPLPAPTENLVRISDDTSWLHFLPSSKHLHKSERWWYETLGSWWLSIKAYF